MRYLNFDIDTKEYEHLFSKETLLSLEEIIQHSRENSVDIFNLQESPRDRIVREVNNKLLEIHTKVNTYEKDLLKRIKKSNFEAPDELKEKLEFVVDVTLKLIKDDSVPLETPSNISNSNREESKHSSLMIIIELIIFVMALYADVVIPTVEYINNKETQLLEDNFNKEKNKAIEKQHQEIINQNERHHQDMMEQRERHQKELLEVISDLDKGFLSNVLSNE